MSETVAVSRLFFLVLLAGCAGTLPELQGFDDLPETYADHRLEWSKRAQLRIHSAEIDRTKSQTETPLLLVHPWGLSMMVWQDVARPWAADRRVVLVDLPGHGKSDKPHAPYTMARLASAVVDVIESRRLESVILVGNSLGGATSLEVALRIPQRVKGLVLLGAPGGRRIPTPLRNVVRSFGSPNHLRSLSDEGWWFGLCTYAGDCERPLVQRIRDTQMALRKTPDWRAFSLASITILDSVADYVPEVERIEVPALVVHGSSDWVVSASSNEVLAKRLPQGRYVEIDGCGHMPQMECPDKLQALVGPFLHRDPTR